MNGTKMFARFKILMMHGKNASLWVPSLSPLPWSKSELVLLVDGNIFESPDEDVAIHLVAST